MHSVNEMVPSAGSTFTGSVRDRVRNPSNSAVSIASNDQRLPRRAISASAELLVNVCGNRCFVSRWLFSGLCVTPDEL